MKAFITGSRAYGTPREDSDLDLVILVDEITKVVLRAVSGVPEDKSVRFGQLNLVILTSAEKFNLWQSVTNALVAKGPVTHDEAVAAFRAAGLGGEYINEASAPAVTVIDPFEV